MSAGSGGGAPSVNRDLNLLAPKFREAVEAALKACESANLGAMVFEGYRSQELQALYYARGRTIIPPERPVTNAATNLYSWHGYGLAVDVVHRERYWEPQGGLDWFRQVADRFKAHGCKWGGDWRSPDPPHMQWGRCKASPSALARRLLKDHGLQAVWLEVGAADPAPAAATAPGKKGEKNGQAGLLHLSEQGAALIKAFESCMEADGKGNFVPYRCPAGVLTIGWGHTNHSGRQFDQGAVWTQKECDQAFSEDMTVFEAAVRKAVLVPLSQHQFDALVSFTYNLGETNLRNSTLLRKLNAGDYEGAALEFHRWTRSNGEVLRGLVRRRASEALMFQGIPDQNYDGAADGPLPRVVDPTLAAIA